MPTKETHSDLSDAPAYTIADAAKYLGLPVTTVRTWVKGQNYKVRDDVRRYRPLVKAADSSKGLLSFRNLVELHVLSVTRRIHGISMPKMRTAVNYLQEAFGTDHPLADVPIKTDGSASSWNNCKSWFPHLVRDSSRSERSSPNTCSAWEGTRRATYGSIPSRDHRIRWINRELS
jgi:hypothetical protein